MTTLQSGEVLTVQKEKESEMQSHSDSSSSSSSSELDSETTDTSPKAPIVATKKKQKSTQKKRDIKKTPKTGKVVKKAASKKEARVAVRKIAQIPGQKKKNSSLLKSAAGGIKRPHRFRPGTVALREIRKYQKTTENLVPKTAVLRLVREIISEKTEESFQLTKGAKQLLHDLFEDEGVKQFQITQLAALHAGRVTIQPSDMKNANNIRNTHPGHLPTKVGNASPEIRAGRLANRQNKNKNLKKQKIKDIAVALDEHI